MLKIAILEGVELVLPRSENPAETGTATAGDGGTTFAGCGDVVAVFKRGAAPPIRNRQGGGVGWLVAHGGTWWQEGEKTESLSGTFLLVRTTAIGRRPVTLVVGCRHSRRGRFLCRSNFTIP